MKQPLLFLAFVVGSIIGVKAQTAITIQKTRPAQLDISGYQKIAVGDITGSDGLKTTRSMDLTDALTSELFNAKTIEVIDRNALADILSSQRGSGIKAINETTAAALSKKLGSALMIVGRIQNEKLYREKKSSKNVVVTNGCYYSYWWELSGDITATIKIIDVKTGKMLFSNAVSQKINIRTNSTCDSQPLGDTEPLLQDANKGLAHSIANIVLPYGEDMTLIFETPMVTLFKNPFKKLDAAIQSFKNNDNATGLEILKAYADDASLKPNLKEKAIFNYGVGLFIANQYDLAITAFKSAATQGSVYAPGMIQKAQDEQRMASRLRAHSK